MFGVQICAQHGFGGFASPKVRENKLVKLTRFFYLIFNVAKNIKATH